MRQVFLFLLVAFAFYPQELNAESFNLCPLCTKHGEVICPGGYEPACPESTEVLEPKCIFYGARYVPGCYKYVGIQKLDLDFSGGLPKGYKVDVIGGGETYTLDREIVGCKKL